MEYWWQWNKHNLNAHMFVKRLVICDVLLLIICLYVATYRQKSGLNTKNIVKKLSYSEWKQWTGKADSCYSYSNVAN